MRRLLSSKCGRPYPRDTRPMMEAHVDGSSTRSTTSATLPIDRRSTPQSMARTVSLLRMCRPTQFFRGGRRPSSKG